MKTRRIVAALIALFMIVAMMPTAVLGAVDNTPGLVTASKVLVTDTEGKPVIDANGNYTIRISVEGNPVEQTVNANADVVLVIDNSGSMASSVGVPCTKDLSTIEPELVEYSILLGFIKIPYWRYKCDECHAVYTSGVNNLIWDDRPADMKCIGEKGNSVRIESAIELGKTFAANILSSTTTEKTTNRMAVIGFAHNQNNGNISAIRVTSGGLLNDVENVKSYIAMMQADGGTDYTSALREAYNILNNRSADEKATRPAYVIFISDGAPGLRGDSPNDTNWNGQEQVIALKNVGVTIFTAGINLNNNEASYLRSMASDNKDEHFINVTGTDYYTQLDGCLSTWAKKIKSLPAGTNAVLTDVIDTIISILFSLKIRLRKKRMIILLNGLSEIFQRM